jgi:hypothetical protein
VLQGRGSHLPRNQPGLCNRAPGGCSHRSCCRHYAAIGTVSNGTPECTAAFVRQPQHGSPSIGGGGHSRSHLFCPLARHLSGMHPTHSLDAVVDSLRASELLECRCRPDLNADRAPTEAVVATKCQDPACTGLFRVVVHPRHGLGGPARANSALGASLVVLRPWQHAARSTQQRTSNKQRTATAACSQHQPAAATTSSGVGDDGQCGDGNDGQCGDGRLERGVQC